MKVKGLDGKEYSWTPARNQARSKERSNLHDKAKKLLEEIFPFDRILEEVSLPGSKTSIRKSVLRADFVVPNRNLIVEVHGEQHFKYNSHFFKNKMNFYKAQARDKDKVEWCNLNDITFVALKYNEDIYEWRSKIE